MKHEKNLNYVNGRWVCAITIDGKRTRKFVGYTKEQALNALAKMRLDALDARLGFKKPGNGEAVPFKAFADSIIETSKKQGKRSWQRDETSLAHLADFFKDKSLAEIGPEAVEEYKSKRRGDVQPATVNLELAFLKSIFNTAVRFGKIDKNPIAAVKKFKENNARERILTPDEIQRLFAAAGPDLKAILTVALGTGMRRGEILALRWADLDLVRGIITITTSKSGKPRKVQMSGAVAATLGAMPKLGDHVFHNPETGTHVMDVKTSFRAACARAKKNPEDKKDPGIPGLRFHDLRHTFATLFIEQGGDIVALSRILGHSTIQMTMRYAHSSEEHIRETIGRVADLLDRGRQKSAIVAEAPVGQPRANDCRTYN